MTKKISSRSELAGTLDLIEDYFSGGFSRRRPEAEAEGIENDVNVALGDQGEHHAQVEVRADGGERAHEDGPGDNESRVAALAIVAEQAAACSRCALSMNRKLTVPGEGAINPSVLLVGEGPGEEEDRTGRPFVGRAGQYLDTWLPPIGLERGKCFVANCVKCRPPQNREPRPEEIAACSPFLERQIEVLRPRTILCLGRIAAQRILESSKSLSGLRGKIHSKQGIPVVITYHPSAVLRDQGLKRPVWEDLKLLKTLLG
jgi:uracil-DNA glycosylase family 4